MSKLEKQGECLIWTGFCDKYGYGRFRTDGLDIKAHRYSYLITFGAVPPLLRHTCDNPPCVTVNHLIPGTHKDNTDDMIARGRHKPNKMKFSKELEDRVRSDRVSGETLQSLSEKYNTSYGHIQWILKRGE